jgi:uncharacterized protein
MLQSSDWISRLYLTKHIEGGWYSEVYVSPLTLPQSSLPGTLKGNRSVCTHIYFLLEQNDFSALHKINSDELWHFYDGDPIIIYEIENNGQLTEHKLGNDPANGFVPFCMVKAGNWFGSRVAGTGNYALVGCTVAPGFDFSDFELAKANELAALYPAHKVLIQSLCRR